MWPIGNGEAASLLRARDWSQTPLGPAHEWPQSLRTAVDLALACKFPMIVLWGPDLVQIYNDAYRDIMGTKHPEGVGQPTRECWPEVWHFNEPVYTQVFRGETLTFEDQVYPITRYGYLEEAYFTLCYSPLRDEAGAIQGVLVTVLETTGRVKAEAALRASEARLTELFHQAPAFFALLRGPNHVFEMINPSYQKLIGTREVLGRSVREALPEAAEQGFTDTLDQVYRTGKPFFAHGARIALALIPGQPKHDRYLNFVYQPMREPDGVISGIIVHGVDVTDATEAAKALSASEAELRWTLQLIPQIPWTADPAGRILDISDGWAELTGLPRKQALGDAWWSALPSEDKPRVAEAWNHALRTGLPYDIEHRIRTASGTYRWMHASALPRRDDAGNIVKWYGSTEDVDARKSAEEALLQSEKLAAVGRLASSISHEINNPLEAVTNLLYLIEHGSEDPKQVVEFAQSAQRELTRVSQITTQTLRFFKQSTLPTTVDTAELLDSVLILYQGRLANSDISIERDFDGRPDVLCYEGEIRQVLNNLVGNALDAMRTGGRLLVRTRPATDWPSARKGVRITVADTGHGMSRETQSKIFQPFFTTKGMIGTGLGLWVSIGIVEKNNASLTVRSSHKEGQSGTVFSLFVPDLPPKHTDALKPETGLPR